MSNKKVLAADDVPMIDGSEEVPKEFRRIYSELVSLTDEFCNELLDNEYQQLCREVAIELCQDGSPVVRGKRASWASGIVYSVGRVNFLGDSSFEPHVRSEEIAKWFGVSTATMQSKSKIIREGLEMVPLDPDFTVESRLANNPLIWMVKVNGFMVDLRLVPRDIQQAAFEQGVIPFIPADQHDEGDTYALVHERVARSGGENPATRSKVQSIYQLKVALDGIRPPIWRRLQVPDCTLEELHAVVQDAMGWHDCHLHEFIAGKERFSSVAMQECGEVDPGQRREADVLLSELVEAGHKKMKYWYDFGDDWWHTITIEKTLQPTTGVEYPVCTTGKRACPPEDIGGVWGYADFVEAMADPKHDQHEDLSNWHGKEFDAEAFDLDRVNKLLQR